MTRPRSFHRGRSGARRLTQWLGPALQDFLSVADGGATLISSLSFEEPLTVTRVRGMVSLRASSAADLNIVGAYGEGIVSTEAFNAGVASIPEPFTDADWGGWFVWRSFSYRFDSITQAGVFTTDWNFEVDSKAMRKVQPNETLVAVAESFNGAYSISAPLRTLLKLS